MNLSHLFRNACLVLALLSPSLLSAQATTPVLRAPHDTVQIDLKGATFKFTFKVSETSRERLVRIGPANRTKTMHVRTGQDSAAFQYQNKAHERFKVTNGQDTIDLVFSYFTPAPHVELNKKASAEYANKNYQASVDLYRQSMAATPKGQHARTTLYNMACGYALMGKKKEALQALQQAVAVGYKDVDHLKKDDDLRTLREEKKYHHLVKQLEKQKALLSDPMKAQLVTTDVHNFWKAYDMAAKNPAQKEQIFEKEYFGKASLGLEDYYQNRIGSVEQFLSNLHNKTDFFKAIRKNTLAVDTMKAGIYASFRKMKELYPAASFPNVYFVIGRYTSAGTASENGLLIGIDQYSRTADVPMHEMNLWERNNYDYVQNVPVLIAHELIHFIQVQRNDTTLLSNALAEGMADFIGELISGQNINQRIHAFANPREKQIWQEFEKEMYLDRSHNWLGNGSQERPDRPADLGYYMGYKICEAFYQKATDKKQAIKDILEITDARAFFEKSGYAQKFAQASN
ncbi:tetratricopeptide repeat protein [Rufibacter sp. LB8]|uniref:tetratricopeptide repeat protein n=1 Tax=Rufibacter sp. LB8 TaxID=2777781 RepID=UPI00178C62C0|nr:tetratricopeptide repeat protein [Rufibacter sp. LB8]